MGHAGFRIYIPTYNDSEAVRETLESCADLPVLIIDNGSSKEHVQALSQMEGPNRQIIFHRQNIGRVENWAFCVEHFLQSGDNGPV